MNLNLVKIDYNQKSTKMTRYVKNIFKFEVHSDRRLKFLVSAKETITSLTAGFMSKRVICKNYMKQLPRFEGQSGIRLCVIKF